MRKSNDHLIFVFNFVFCHNFHRKFLRAIKHARTLHNSERLATSQVRLLSNEESHSFHESEDFSGKRCQTLRKIPRRGFYRNRSQSDVETSALDAANPVSERWAQS